MEPTKQQDQALGGQGLEWGLFWAVVITQHANIHHTWEDGVQSPEKVQVTHWEKQEKGKVLEEGTTGRSSDTAPRGRWREGSIHGTGAQEGAHATITGPGTESDETCPLHIPTKWAFLPGLDFLQ